MFPEIQLDGQSQIPLYRQLFEKIGSLVESGRLVQGDRLPPTRELAGLLGLNRATVASAYTLLEKAGYIKGHVGRGSFVTARPGAPPAARRWQDLFAPDSEPATGALLSPLEAPISFATSKPSESLFPVEEFRKITRRVLRDPGLAAILQLGSPLGYEPLRTRLLERARAAGVARDGDDILITNGCQQALDLLQRVFIQPGDSVVVEDPVYPGLQQVFRRAGAKLIGVPVGETGIDLEFLEACLRRERPKLLLLTPNFQNPTGITMPSGARSALVRLARQAGVAVVESDIYSELRYDGEPLPSLKALDESGDGILLGSFSKIAFPGLRVGWILAPRAVTSRLAEARQWSDLHGCHLAQAVLLHFLQSGALDAHKSRVVEAGRTRRDAVVKACAREFPEGAQFTRPRGGMNLWLQLPGWIDADSLLARARPHGVAFLPGRYFAVSRPHIRGLRLSFAGLEPAKIRRGVEILGRIVKEEFQRNHGSERFEQPMALV